MVTNGLSSSLSASCMADARRVPSSTLLVLAVVVVVVVVVPSRTIPTASSREAKTLGSTLEARALI